MPDLPPSLRTRLDQLGMAPVEVLSLVVLLLGALGLSGAIWWANGAPGGEPVDRGPPLTASPIADGGSLDPGAPGPESLPPGVGPDATSATSATSAASATSATSAAEAPLVVHVAGHVREPGVVSLPAGARVADAVRAAGGPTPDGVLDALNLARGLVDGEQVRVPGEGETPPPAPAGPVVAAQADDGIVSLNHATAADLEALPGIGPVTAARIIAHRDEIGGFADLAQLLEVPGIGPARFADLRERVQL